MVTRAFAQWPSRGSLPIRSSIAEKHYWYSRLLPGLSPLCGPISYLIIQGWIISWCLESTGLSMWIPRCIFYGEIRQCTCNWQWKLLLVWLTVCRVADIHWRLIAGDMQQLALMWMEGHNQLLFPILYHILKFISVSLGTDLSIMRQSSVNSLVCDGSIRWGRSLIYTRNKIGPSTVPCVLCPKSQVWYVMISLQDQQFYPSHRETIGSIQRYSHQCRFLGSFSKRP